MSCDTGTKHFTVNATAHDPSGATADYNGPATWSSLDGAITPSTPTSFVHGVSTTTTTKIGAPFHADSITVTAAGVSGQSAAFDVLGPFAAIDVNVPPRPTATVPFSLQATAVDRAGNMVTSYNGPASWSSLDGGLTPAAPSNFVDGVSTTMATIPAHFARDQITVSSGGISGQSDLFFVIGPFAIQLRLPPRIYAGVPFPVTLVAQSVTRWVILTEFNAPAGWSDLSGHLAPAAPASFVSGISTTQATIDVPVHADRITATGGGITVTSSPLNVLGPFARISTRLALPVSAGAPFTFTALATDSAGNVLAGYNAPATWSDLSGSLSPAVPSPFVSGVSTTIGKIASPFHYDRLTVRSGAVSGQTGYFNVFGPLAKIRVEVAKPVRHGVPFAVKAIAFDASGNALRGYGGSAIWSNLGGGISPTTPSAFEHGVSTTLATLPWAFLHDRITVTSQGIAGQSGVFSVS